MKNFLIKESKISNIFPKPIYEKKFPNPKKQLKNQNPIDYHEITQDYIDRVYSKYFSIFNKPLNRHIFTGEVEKKQELATSLNISLESINLRSAIENGITGKDVVVAVIDSGIIYDHPDIEKSRIIYYKDFSNESTQENPKDILGHGTYVASLIGGTGKASNGYNRGIAPGVKFVILRITSVSEVIKALEWLKENGKKYNIKVINMSLGIDPEPEKSWAEDIIAKLANDLAQEYTVVAAAGNDQTYETIDSPGIAPDVITVGGSDTKNTPHISDDEIYIGSSKGPTPTKEKLDKPDVIAPSKKVVGARVPNSIFDPYLDKNFSPQRTEFLQTTEDEKKTNSNKWEKGYYIESSGTSAGTALVSGLAALLYEILPNATPQLIKKIITQSTNKLKDKDGKEFDKYSQGNGLIDIQKAIKIAITLKNQNLA
ncbi:MAG: S8 family serine peptidase [Candidatus Calescibacterium sp.]|nr:S8 family serine peptidase [Candidatus Calescibacterium sp.]MCX7972224.1 S8 family serine peptidase [bacterium]MDW8195175.1 S8 family serine peptidase [Candidatus Calescibacterium sp.]